MTSAPSQMKMQREVSGAPAAALPADGVSIRTFRRGDDESVAGVYRACGLGAADAVERLLAHPSFLPERLFVAEDRGAVAGTAAAFVDRLDATSGFLHMMGVLPDHRGRGLGRALVVATLSRHREEGRLRQWLRTDEHRVDAIRLYLGLGYRPLYFDETHEARWARLLREIGRPELIAEAAWGSA